MWGKAIPFPLCEVSSSRYYVSAGLWVPYLAFADDTIIFTRCSADTLTPIKDLLQLYQACSGQKVNIAKSSLSPSPRMTEACCSLVRSILGVREQKLPFIYLGVPMIRGRETCAMFDGLLSKMRHRLCHWSLKMLSMGGKIVLIRHVLCSLPIY